MARMNIDKVVSALPSTLEPNTMYGVRNGVGFDLYLSDMTGTVAHPINNRQEIRGSGRVYGYTNNRWVTNSDDNYGPAYYQFNENAGTAVDPIAEWEHMGDMILPGTRIKSLTIAGKTNNTQFADMEVYGLLRKPDPITRWETGMDNDGEDTVTDLCRGLFRTSGEYLHTGLSNDFLLQKWNFDVVANDVSMLSIYFKPVGVITATRYMRLTYMWELEI